MASRYSRGQCTVELTIAALVFLLLILKVTDLSHVAEGFVSQTQLSRSGR